VLYKNYPSAKIDKNSANDEEDEEGKRTFSLGKKNDKKQLDEKKEEEIPEDNDSGAGVTIQPLFKFECD